jgi:hypothetical protein
MAESQRIWKPSDLAEFLRVSVGWVYSRTGPSAPDPIPRCKGIRRIRFDTASKEFQGWLARNLGIDVDSNGPTQ